LIKKLCAAFADESSDQSERLKSLYHICWDNHPHIFHQYQRQIIITTTSLLPYQLRLKDSARKLTPFAHQQSSSVAITNAITAGNTDAYIQRLDEHVSEAFELCSLIEVCLMNGIRVKEFQGVIPLWGLLERLVSVQKMIGKNPGENSKQNVSPPKSSLQQGNQNLQLTVEKIARMTSLRTPVAKSRAWIRHALNLRVLDECLSSVLSEAKLVSLFYTPDAIVSNADNVTILIAVLRTLKVLPFAFSLSDVSLNSTPSWTVAMVATGGYRPVRSPPSDFPMVTGRSSNSSYRAPQKQKGMLSSIFGSIERSINGVLESVDTMASRAMEIDPKEGREARDIREGRERDSPPLTPLFGTPLRDLILDDRRCGVCHMDPQLGIPSMIICMISYLTSNVNTPGLFRQKVSFDSSEELRVSLEYERGIPRMGEMSSQETVLMVHVVASTLLQWLTELPEPLLGSLHYSALEACQDVEDEGPRIRNFSLLIQEAPWYCQPLLSKMLTLLSLCLREENACKNGLNLVAISVLFTPFLYRRDAYLHHVREHPRAGGSFFNSLGDLHFVERDEEARNYLSIASAGEYYILLLIVYFYMSF
jgi:RUN domain/RhoGAP domain